MIIGLTGASGSGKSTVAKCFEKYGFLVIDYDKITHEIYENCLDCINEIRYNFEGVVDENNKLDRKKLARIVFGDKKKLDILNKISHKYIIKKSEEIINANSGKDIILDAPLLFEANLQNICDYTVCTICNSNKKIERIMKRDNLTFEMAKSRVENRICDDEFAKKCDFVIDTTFGVNENDIKGLLNKFN